MKKEVFLAVFVGFALGLIITFGIWTVNKSLTTQTPNTSPAPQLSQSTPGVIPSPTPEASLVALTLTNPATESISSTATSSVSGKTLPNTPVIITSESNQIITASDSTGNFTSDIKLEAGYNRINVTAYDASGNSTTKSVLVTFTTSKI